MKINKNFQNMMSTDTINEYCHISYLFIRIL